MKILVIENEYDSISPVFEAVEKLVLKQTIEIVRVDKSQDVPWDVLDSFNAIFVDLSLATKSQQDGYGVVATIKERVPIVLNKTAIITGNDMVRESLTERGLIGCNIEIFDKPLHFKDIAAFINK